MSKKPTGIANGLTNYGDRDFSLYLRRSFAQSMGYSRPMLEKPVVGIAYTPSGFNNCHRHFPDLLEAVKRGVLASGALPIEFPTISLGEVFLNPTSLKFRNLMSMDTEEMVRAQPMDAVVLMGGCDKTVPAQLMGAVSAAKPAIMLVAGPMMTGRHRGERLGACTDCRRFWAQYRAGKIDDDEISEVEGRLATTAGTCAVMGTASTMNALAEALGMSLPGCAAIPAPYRERAQIAYETGLRAVEIVEQDLKPSDILTRKAFENAIVANSAIGGSTNAPVHINAIARHVGVNLSIEDWEKIGYDVPLLVNMQPAGEYLGEEYYRAGGLPAVMHELLKAKRIHPDALTINGKTMGENVRQTQSTNADVIKPYRSPMKRKAGFKVLKGNLFDSAIMKTSVISDEFRKRYLSNPKDKDAFEGPAVVFEGPEDYHHRIDDPSLKIDEHTLLFVRGVGPVGYPGAAEVVNMQPPAALIKKGITSLPCIGDGRQSGTSGSPSILNASPEAAANGGLALLKTGDRVRIDLRKGTADILTSKAELARRRKALQRRGGFRYPASQTPWQEIQRSMVDQLADGMVLKPAVKYQRVAQNGVARDNH